MNRKYITIQTRLATLSKPALVKTDIHAQLAETIAERKRIMQQLENRSRIARTIDMYLTSKQAA